MTDGAATPVRLGPGQQQPALDGAPATGSGNRILPAGAAVAGLAALLCLVAAASRPVTGAISQAPPSPAGIAVTINVLAFVGVMLAALAVIALISGLLRRRKRKNEDDEEQASAPELSRLERFIFNTIVVLIPVSLAAGLYAWWRFGHHGAPAQPFALGVPAALPALAPVQAAPLPGSEWLPLSAAAAVLVVAAGAVWLLFPRRRRLLPLFWPETVVGEALARAAIELDDEDDPRRAVIAAYAGMEATFRASGLPRRPAEAPFEYLGRVLRNARVSGTSVHRLTELFERAKFSQHAVDAGMKAAARAALDAVRGQLIERKPHDRP